MSNPFGPPKEEPPQMDEVQLDAPPPAEGGVED